MKKILATLLLLIGIAPIVSAQSLDDQTVQRIVNQLVGARTYKFQATRILSSGGSQSSLSAMKTMTVNKDTLTLNLPYFGKGGSSADAQIGNPLQFTTKNFTYKAEPGNKGGIIVRIEAVSPNNDRFTITMSLPKGNMGKLTLTSASRSTMEFSGFLVELNTPDEDEDE